MAENQQYDIVFVVDNTGSMGSYINGVKNNVATFAKSLGNGNIDYRLGLVEYGDSAEEVKKHDFTTGDFTTDIDEFINDVNSITATGGDDYPEAGLEALQNALTMDPREGAQREFIVLTDASFHDNKDGVDTYLDKDSVIAQLQEANAITNVIGVMGSGCQNEWEPLANATMGKFYDINGSFPDIFESISDEITGMDAFTHKVSFTQWGFGYTPTDAATLASDSSNSITITPSA